METVIVIQNVYTREYFFTTDHCQNHGLGDDFIPCTFWVPKKVAGKECIKDKEDIRKVYFSGGKEIPNPDKKFQA